MKVQSPKPKCNQLILKDYPAELASRWLQDTTLLGATLPCTCKYDTRLLLLLFFLKNLHSTDSDNSKSQDKTLITCYGCLQLFIHKQQFTYNLQL